MRYRGVSITRLSTGRGSGITYSLGYDYALAARHAGYTTWSEFLAAPFDDQVNAIAMYRTENMTQAVLNEQAQRESDKKHGRRKR